MFPSARVRVAELAASMVWSAPIVALLVLPATAALGINMDSNPQQAAYLYGMSLIGTWAALIPNKLFENRSLDMSSRRLIALLAGLVVGAVGIVLGRALQLGLPLERHYFGNSQDLEPLYFGAVRGERRMVWAGFPRSREAVPPCAHRPNGRPGRFAHPALALRSARLRGLSRALPCTVQIVSPWSEQGSRYAKYLRSANKQKQRVKTA